MSDIIAIYADGGVIGANPSEIGGTYAYRLIKVSGEPIGFANVLPGKPGAPVTNNQTEMLAIIRGLSKMPRDFAGTVYSDSAVSLGRLFKGWRWSNVPKFIHDEYRDQVMRLIFWDKISYVLLDGHPTAAQLAAGIGKRGHPVSEHNVWCDKACKMVGEKWIAQQAPIDQDWRDLNL
jgi:ribonuclease HI